MIKLINVSYIEQSGKIKTSNNGFTWRQDGHVYTAGITGYEDMNPKAIRLNFSIHGLMEEKMLSNGYQSWSETKFYGAGDRIKPLFGLAKMLHLNQYGDYHFYEHKARKGFIPSHEYTIFSGDKKHLMVASLNQEDFYVIFERDYKQDTFSAYLDVDGLEIKKGKPFQEVRFLIVEGDSQSNLYDQFEGLLPTYRKPGLVCNGWTSWYNYYTNIDNDIIHHNLEALAENPIDFDVFQIDDGYQVAVGDWLNTNEKFEDDLRPIAESAKAKGMKPGLWLAPFACERDSFIYEEKKDWLLRDQDGKLVYAGFNPQWSGNFYALDIFNPEVEAYLREVFKKVFDQWQFKLVKLDFLYAANMVPRPGKTRAMVMDYAMKFLDEVCEGEILGCGIPMGSAFKRVEYCRIGADVGPYWEDKKLRFLGYRERISTRAAIYNTLNRYGMNARFFSNDPDVFIIREEDNKLTADEKYTLFMVNQLLGDLVFFSDDISRYDQELKTLTSAVPIPRIGKAEIIENNDLYKITFDHQGFTYEAYVNMSDDEVSVKLGNGYYYSGKSGLMIGLSQHTLKPHESYLFVRLFSDTFDQGPIALLNEHMLLGAGVDSVEIEEGKACLEYRSGYEGFKDIVILSKSELKIDNIQGQSVEHCSKGDIHIYQNAR